MTNYRLSVNACYLILILSLFWISLNECACTKGKRKPWYEDYSEIGYASWYGKKFHRNKTASGERYNMYHKTAAHPKLPFGTVVKVINLENGRTVKVRINDRGPFVKGRIIDLSYSAAKKLKMIKKGTARVKVVVVKVPDEIR